MSPFFPRFLSAVNLGHCPFNCPCSRMGVVRHDRRDTTRWLDTKHAREWSWEGEET